MGIALGKELVLLGVRAGSRYELLGTVADNLRRHGLVKESYRDAVIARERSFATGLPTVGGGVAIPHTDAEHVEAAAISFARPERPVEFAMMGDMGRTVKACMVFMLALKDAYAQAGMLQELMGILQDKAALDFLRTEEDAGRISTFLRERLPQGTAAEKN